MSHSYSRFDLESRYLSWLNDMIDCSMYPVDMYQNLLNDLYIRPFIWTLHNDDNREDDGYRLRDEFADIICLDPIRLHSHLKNECTILEMMIALCKRCNDTLLYDPDRASIIPKIFWGMIESLGLIHMSDEAYDARYVDLVLTKFLDHGYSKDGSGGLFTVKDKHLDMRKMEIWYQMNHYLEENYDDFA